jgi:hypothetical protein
VNAGRRAAAWRAERLRETVDLTGHDDMAPPMGRIATGSASFVDDWHDRSSVGFIQADEAPTAEMPACDDAKDSHDPGSWHARRAVMQDAGLNPRRY